MIAHDLRAASRAPGPPAQAVVRFFGRLDAALRTVAVPHACEPGCSYCCHYRVMVTAPEVFALAQHVKANWPAPAATDLVSRLRDYTDRTRAMTSAQHEGTNMACAFLRDGRCSVYEIRPLACRRHHSLDATPCIETFHNPRCTAMITTSEQHVAVASGFANAQLMAEHALGLDLHMYELHAALLDALTNPASLKRWKTGKISFPVVKDRQLPV